MATTESECARSIPESSRVFARNGRHIRAAGNNQETSFETPLHSERTVVGLSVGGRDHVSRMVQELECSVKHGQCSGKRQLQGRRESFDVEMTGKTEV